MDLPKFNEFFLTKLSRLPPYLSICSSFFNFNFLLDEPLRYCLDDMIIIMLCQTVFTLYQLYLQQSTLPIL